MLGIVKSANPAPSISGRFDFTRTRGMASQDDCAWTNEMISWRKCLQMTMLIFARIEGWVGSRMALGGSRIALGAGHAAGALLCRCPDLRCAPRAPSSPIGTSEKPRNEYLYAYHYTIACLSSQGENDALFSPGSHGWSESEGRKSILSDAVVVFF